MSDDDKTPKTEEAEPPTSPETPKARGNTSATDAIEAAALDRDTKALNLRIGGKTFDYISAKLGFGGRSNAHRAVRRRLAAMRTDCEEKAEELKQLELARLDRLQRALWSAGIKGEVEAIDRILRIMARRAALEGLDKPKGLTVELSRAIDDALDRVKNEFPPDVYERLLAVFAGDLGTPTSGDAQASEEAGGAGEGGGSSDEGSGSGQGT